MIEVRVKKRLHSHMGLMELDVDLSFMEHQCTALYGASGAGKTTIVRHLLAVEPLLAFSVSATTRQKRDYEKDGVDYHFLSADQFRKQIEENAFVEWEEVYPGKFYGTLRSEVERMWAAGKRKYD